MTLFSLGFWASHSFILFSTCVALAASATTSSASPAYMTTTNSASGLDVVDNMCVRWWHQSTIKNRTLYIDGGNQVFKGQPNGSRTESVVHGYNNKLITIDLTTSWDASRNLTQRWIDKIPAADTGTFVPSYVRATLYQGALDDPNIYLYGGSTDYWNTSFPNWTWPLPQQFSLWSYDTRTHIWEHHDVSAETPWRPSSGSSTEAPDLGLGFYFNGELNSGSSSETQNMKSNITFLEGMTVVDTNARTTRNISTAAVTGDYAHDRGGLEYVPGIGEKGILVSFGGAQKKIAQVDDVEADEFVPMDEILVFDVNYLFANDSESGGWYKQKATGDIPSPRRQFCTVLVSAPDNSSHNIYLYGGAKGPKDFQFFDDVYILSIPSFTWTKIYGPGPSPRYGHTCHAVGNRQMISVGGAPSWGFDGPCDTNPGGIRVFDLSEGIWSTNYNVTDKGFEVPSKVVDVIGGDRKGGARMNQPNGGFLEARLATMFGVPYTPPPPKNRAGMIAGSVIGAISAVALLFSLLFFWKRRAKMRKHDESKGQDKNLKEKDAEDQRNELGGGMIEAGPQGVELYGHENVELELPAYRYSRTSNYVELPVFYNEKVELPAYEHHEER